MGKKDADVYLRAAERVALGKSYCCCWAIEETMRNDHSKNGWTEQSRQFTDTFEPQPRGWMSGGFWGKQFGLLQAEQTNGRILALCFAAAMAETGDL